MKEVNNVYIDVDDSYNQEHGERPQLNFITIAVHATVDGDEVLQQYDVSSDGVAEFNYRNKKETAIKTVSLSYPYFKLI